ncbi:toll/interleukin-1 receptor domain-containing protein [Frankia sp. AgB1.9]|uniref:toll/interleukin-1 receptor domain-containing protein n=1 Tax=unclassified Frankia TaxID=2632575 RepID=UPI0019322070|nr:MULTISPECIES: toll/interleukin-1 receptor domain-containing protein [unclassified Frankia]MBL7491855.1 toll/interleukin-1 receptor domain-containing protein [Frankia sp. AgW1.1]MBL7553885.1 toll/interleukin-1 receptor domain-containing protein [Frankia sp. AgB1.9]MBL7618025.1 toll/interleukin-1 receptor domain-containing protein [Frankia sp. AgB1.8]
MSTFNADQLGEFARVYSDPVSARQLLLGAGMDAGRIPTSTVFFNSASFWDAVNEYLSKGQSVGLRDSILARAHDEYPDNSYFWSEPTEPSVQRQQASGRSGPGAPPGPSMFGLIIGVDAERYSDLDAIAQRDLRERLRKIFGQALAEAGIGSSGSLQDQDRGDGFLGVVAATVPAERVVRDFVHRLSGALLTTNHNRHGPGRIRLRLALHHGHVIPDGSGWAGDPIVECARLLDADLLRGVLEDDPHIDLALLVSDRLYESVIRPGIAGIDLRAFHQVDVVGKRFRAVGWLSIPERGIAGPVNGWPARQPAGSAGSRSADPAGEPPVGAARSTRSAPDPPPAAGKTDKGERWDFLVSAAPDDEGWGDWIAWHLKAENYSVRLESWDLLAGDESVDVLDLAVTSCDRTIAVLSPAYLESRAVRAAWQQAWHNAWLRDPNGLKRTLIPVRVKPCEPAGLLRGIRYIDLVDRREADAKAYLKEQIRRSVTGNGRPTEPPPFPGPR